MIPLPASLRSALALALGLSLLSAKATAVLPPKPNIILFLVDDMGWTDAGCLGSQFYETPHLDRLAASGVRFTDAYASCAVCSPTRAAILTGKAPARLHLTDWIPGEGSPKKGRWRVPDWQQNLPQSEVTLAEALKGRGYATASIGKWHLGGPAFHPQHQGFDLNIAGGDIGHPASFFWPYGDQRSAHRVPHLADQGGHSGEYLTDRLTDEALRFVETNKDRPFFLYLAHYALHAPLMGKEALVEREKGRPGQRGQSNAVYAAMIQSVDESLGRLLRWLDERRLADRTIILFTSDNGGAVHFGTPPATSNTPLRLGKGYPYEGGLRVPLILRVPGLAREGSVCQTPVISHDFFPTLLELAGALPNAADSNLDGVSLIPLLRDDKPGARDALFWHYPHYWFGTHVTPYSATRVGDWKLIHFYEEDRDELYNLRDDLGETTDLAAKHPDKRAELRSRLDTWLEQVDAQLPRPKPEPAPDSPPVVMP